MGYKAKGLLKNETTLCLLKNETTICLLKNETTICLLKNETNNDRFVFQKSKNYPLIFLPAASSCWGEITPAYSPKYTHPA